MKKHEELVIITKTYDLILWSCNHTGRFPRQHRFVLGSVSSDTFTMPHPPPSQPARVWTSASARTVPAGCGGVDQDGGARGMVSR